MIKLQYQIECCTSVWNLACIGWNCFTMEVLFDDKYSFCSIHQLRFNSKHYPPDCRSAFSAVNKLENESASQLCLTFFYWLTATIRLLDQYCTCFHSSHKSLTSLILPVLR